MFNHLIFHFARESRYNDTVDLRDTVDNNLVCKKNTVKWWDTLINYLWTGAGFRPSTVCNIDSIWANYYPFMLHVLGYLPINGTSLRRCRFVFSYDGGSNHTPEPSRFMAQNRDPDWDCEGTTWSSHYIYICMIPMGTKRWYMCLSFTVL